LVLDEVELHGEKAVGASQSERMLGHDAGNSPTGKSRVGDVAAVGNAVAASGPVSAEGVRSDNPVVRDGNAGLPVRSHPAGKGIGLAHIAGKRIGFAGTNL